MQQIDLEALAAMARDAKERADNAEPWLGGTSGLIRRLADAVLALVERARVLELNARWQPIEAAPKDGSIIFLWHYNEELERGEVWKGNWLGGEFVSSQYGYSLQPTHWMPLPAPPER